MAVAVLPVISVRAVMNRLAEVVTVEAVPRAEPISEKLAHQSAGAVVVSQGHQALAKIPRR